MSETRKERIERMEARGKPRAARIGMPDLPRLVARAFEREDGHGGGAAPQDVEYLPRSAETPEHRGAPDMRSAAIRRIVEETYASRQESVARAQGRAAPGKKGKTGEAKAPGDDLSALGTWYEEMKGKGIDGQALIDEAKKLMADYK